MNKLQLKNVFSVIENYDAFLFDLWGVIVEGEQVYPGVVDTINQIIKIKKVFFVTNSPRPTLAALARIQSWGINATAGMVITSGEIARELINNSKLALGIDYPKVFHLGQDRNDEIMQNLRCEQVSNIDLADIMILSLARNEGEDLTEFDNILDQVAASNILTICANPDTIIPRGEAKVYCPGFFAVKIAEKGGRIIYTGKPERAIYDKVLERLSGIEKSRILMIGDTFDTDILGAERAGIQAALVLSGNAKKFHQNYEQLEQKLAALEQAAKQQQVMPNLVIDLKLR